MIYKTAHRDTVSVTNTTQGIIQSVNPGGKHCTEVTLKHFNVEIGEQNLGDSVLGYFVLLVGN